MEGGVEEIVVLIRDTPGGCYTAASLAASQQLECHEVDNRKDKIVS